MYPDTSVVYREPIYERLSAAEMQAAKLEFSRRRFETECFYSRAVMAGNIASRRFFSTALKILDRQREEFFSVQTELADLAAHSVHNLVAV